MTGIVRVSRRYRAPASLAFDAWLDPAIAGRWLFATATRPMTHVDIDARVGGAFRFAGRRGATLVEHAGVYVALEPSRRLGFALYADDRCDAQTLVDVEIAPRGEGCRLTLSHEQVPADRARDQKARWTGILYGLGVTLETIRLSAAPSARDDRRAATGELQCITC